MKNAFLIAAASSGSGKTTLALGLMRAFKRRKIGVQPFKCGPDYIDTQYHRVATGRDSINLDLFMAGEGHVRNLFDSYCSASDVGIVEGAMGMFDGFDGMRGSSADIAHTLDIPVVLLVDAKSTSYSVAATIYGFTRFNPNVKVAGVIFNRVASPNHYLFLQEACRAVDVECFGYIKKNEALKTPSRHLGLSLDSLTEIERFVDAAADEVEMTVDVDRIMKATELHPRTFNLERHTKSGLKVAVARDEAFSFIYPANIEALNSDIVYFSPLHDDSLPDADMVYLPGGYPELYAEALESNAVMRNAIKGYAESGGRILAECGGMIYLTEEIDGKKMCGVLPLSATMENARLKLGYRKVVFESFEIFGHEFHYSDIVERGEVASCARQFNIRGVAVDTPVYRYRNVIAGYTHFYWAETDIFKLWNK